MSNIRQMDQDSHSYYLIKQSENILSQLREQARKIETAEQKISTNLKNIRSGQNQLKPLQTQETSIYQNVSFSHNLPTSYYRQNSQNVHPSAPLNISKSFRFCQEMDDIQEYSEEQSQTGPIQTSYKHSFKQQSQYSIKPQSNIQISFANSYVRQQYHIPICQIVFAPFNKLYKSPVLQLKDKNRLILARKYKGSNIKVNDGKICDGKIYKFNKIITDEDQLLQTLIDCPSIGLIGSYGTLKKKIQMCLFIKYYQKLMQSISECLSLQSNILVQYIQFVNKSVVIHIYQQFRFNKSTLKVQSSRISNIFQSILSYMIDKNKSYQKEKQRQRQRQRQKQKIKYKTRIIRIIDQQTKQKFQVISSSNESINLFEEFRFKKIVWCINPLVKHYEMTQNTLEFAKKIQEYDKGERIR